MKVTISNRSTGMKMISITPQEARVTGFARERANRVTPVAPGWPGKESIAFPNINSSKDNLTLFPNSI